jgi:hypothetical protein
MSLTSIVALSAALLAPSVSTTLRVESRAGQVLVHVTVDNRSGATVHVPRALAADPQPFGRTFTLTAEPGAKAIDYAGPMVKRGPIGPADFIAVKPHSTLRHTVDISHSYAFLPGEHSYTLQYAGSAVADVAQLDRATPLAVVPVQFTHTGSAQ